MQFTATGELCVPGEHVTSARVRDLCDLLAHLGVVPADPRIGPLDDPGRIGGYRLSADHQDFEPLHDLATALDVLERAEVWWLDWFVPRWEGNEDTDAPWGFAFRLRLRRSKAEASHQLVTVTLAGDYWSGERACFVFQRFGSWVKFVASVLPPVFGWVDTEENHAYGPVPDWWIPQPPDLRESVAQQELQPLVWINLYGPAYIERLGLPQLLSLPAGHAEFLMGGTVAVTVQNVMDETLAAKHLNLPPPHFDALERGYMAWAEQFGGSPERQRLLEEVRHARRIWNGTNADQPT